MNSSTDDHGNISNWAAKIIYFNVKAVVRRGGEKNWFLINRDYNTDDYDSIITLPKNRLKIIIIFFFLK